MHLLLCQFGVMRKSVMTVSKMLKRMPQMKRTMLDWTRRPLMKRTRLVTKQVKMMLALVSRIWTLPRLYRFGFDWGANLPFSSPIIQHLLLIRLTGWRWVGRLCWECGEERERCQGWRTKQREGNEEKAWRGHWRRTREQALSSLISSKRHDWLMILGTRCFFRIVSPSPILFQFFQ